MKHEISNVTKTYNAAMRKFNNKSNVLSIARANRTTSHSVVLEFCRKTLSQKDAVRVTDLVMGSLS